jgi:enoyl-CoA hydratase/carnithine racemase
MTDDVLFRRDGALGRITLNRPKALNALTLDMVAAMLAELRAWAGDPGVTAVLLEAPPGRAFCAGGDIRALYESGKAGDGKAARFFATEYTLNAAIKHFPKPYVSLIDGIVMGGGAGISIHGAYRVASENAVFAMPETAIGIFPDIGASHFLNVLPGRIGLYLALTSTRITAGDMAYSGLATHFVPAARQGEIAPRLAQGENIDSILAALATAPPPSALAQHREAMDRAFAHDSVEAVTAALGEEGDWGRTVLDMLARCSPTSLKLTMREMAEGKGRVLEDCLATEYRLALRILEGHDFYEGVRAVLIDKDQKPRWRPDSLDAVSEADIARYFAPLGAAEWAPV